MKVKSESKVAQSHPTRRDPMDCSLPGSSIHGVFQARVLEWGAIAFSLFFWDPYNSNVGAFDIVPEVSETILSSFHSFYFIPLMRSYFHHFIFQLTDLFFFRYSAIDSFQSIFNFSNCVASVCLFFNSSRRLLIDSCIFSIFQGF